MKLSCFGIIKKKGTIILTDPIYLGDRLGSTSAEEIKNCYDEIESAFDVRGIYFITLKKGRNANRISNDLEIFRPDIMSGRYCIYFNDLSKSILFKIKKEELKKNIEIRKEIDDVMKKSGLYSESYNKEIKKMFKEFRDEDWIENTSLYFSTKEIDNGSILRGEPYWYLMIKGKNYIVIKNKVVRNFKDDREKLPLEKQNL